MFKMLINNKSFILLTLFLILALYFITKECNLPIIFTTPFFQKLFLRSNNNSIILNISLSYVAAYFFYLLQTLIPQLKNSKIALAHLRDEFTDFIQNICFAIFILENIAPPTIDLENSTEITYSASAHRSNQVYYIVDNKYLKRFTLANSLQDLKTNIRNRELKIKSNAFYPQIDPLLLQELSIINYEDVLDALDKLIIKPNAVFLLKSNKIQNLKNNIEHFTKDADIHIIINNKICEDPSLIEKYQAEIKEYHLELQELIYTIQI